MVVEWVTFLQQKRLWGLDYPLFPATRVVVGPQRRFEAAGLDRRCWANATPIRAIFRDAFKAAGLSYFNPQSPEEFKAWSQNLGHENVMTTFASYGQVDMRRQAEIIRNLGKTKPEPVDDSKLVHGIAELVAQHQRGGGISGRAGT
jgi:hypothetical protein